VARSRTGRGRPARSGSAGGVRRRGTTRGRSGDQRRVAGERRRDPDWSLFSDEDLRDLNAELRERFRARATPEPAAVAYDPQVLTDERRYDVPTTVIECEFPSELLREWIAQKHPYVAELAAMRDVEYIDLPTGHWPQFTKPKELGEAILAAVDRS
jgi:pimeloyl-ACP methyl ester carboxylesterase